MKQHFYYLNTFRLVAAIFILLSHARCELFATYTELNPESQNIFTQIFFVGVQWTTEAMAVFFVLSGFLVGGPMIEQALSSCKEENLLRNFMWKRILRILLPLFFAILFAAAVKSYGHVDYSWSDAFMNLCGLQGLLASDFGGVYWSLAYEIWFYVLIAGIVCLFTTRRFGIGVSCLLLAGSVFVILEPLSTMKLIFGMSLFFMKDLKISRRLLPIFIIGIFVFHFLGLLSADSRAVQTPLNGIISGEFISWGITICIGFLMVMNCQNQPMSKFACWVEDFGSKWCPFTYCLYITHFTVCELFKHLFGQMRNVNVMTIGVYIMTCIFCISFSYMFYYCIEHKLGNTLKGLVIKK